MFMIPPGPRNSQLNGAHSDRHPSPSAHQRALALAIQAARANHGSGSRNRERPRGAVQGAMAFLTRARGRMMVRQPSFQTNRPIPFDIPFDIWASILRFLDHQTLQTFTLLSRDFKHEAEKHLWASCTLFAPAQPLYDAFWTRAHIEEGCTVLLKASRASRLRNLYLDIQSSLGTEGDPEFERVIGLLQHVLLAARKLRSLTIKALHHRPRIAHALSLHASLFPFSLTQLRTDLFVAAPLYPFIASHSSSLSSIELFSVSFAPAGQAPVLPHSLTALTTVRVHQAVQTSILRGAPVRSLELMGVWEGECGVIAENVLQGGMMTDVMAKMRTEALLDRAELVDFGFLLDETNTNEEHEKTLQSWANDAWHNSTAAPSHSSRPTNSHYSPIPRVRSRSRSQSQSHSRQSSSSSPARPLVLSQHHATPSFPPPPPILGPALLSLRLTLHDHPTTSHAYTSLIAHLPHLRLLSLTHSDISDLTHRRRALSVLGTLAELEVFEWSGGAGREGAQADVFDCVSKRCKRLRRIVFRWGGGHGNGGVAGTGGWGAMGHAVGAAGAAAGGPNAGDGGMGGRRGRSVGGRGSDGSWFERRFERCGGDGVWGIVQSC